VLRPGISFPRLRASADTTASSTAGTSLSSTASSRLAAAASSGATATTTGRLRATSTATSTARQGGVRRVFLGIAAMVALAAALTAILRRRLGG
jgi:hypothetical protein